MSLQYMKQISSDFTPILKYILPWAIIIIFISGMIGALITRQFGLAFGLIIIGAVVIGFIRTILMDLKKVFLDKENRQLIVKSSIEESIPFEDVKEILIPWTPPYITTIKVIKDYSFGKTFTFIPEGHPRFWDKHFKDLKERIRN
jgi:hypothetical protein